MQATTKRRAVVLVTAGALGLGGIAVASPALAGAGVFDASLAATTQQDGPPIGMGMGAGMRDAPDVTQAYQHLLAASRQHLAAFTTWATR